MRGRAPILWRGVLPSQADAAPGSGKVGYLPKLWIAEASLSNTSKTVISFVT